MVAVCLVSGYVLQSEHNMFMIKPRIWFLWYHEGSFWVYQSIIEACRSTITRVDMRYQIITWKIIVWPSKNGNNNFRTNPCKLVLIFKTWLKVPLFLAQRNGGKLNGSRCVWDCMLSRTTFLIYNPIIRWNNCFTFLLSLWFDVSDHRNHV